MSKVCQSFSLGYLSQELACHAIERFAKNTDRFRVAFHFILFIIAKFRFSYFQIFS